MADETSWDRTGGAVGAVFAPPVVNYTESAVEPGSPAWQAIASAANDVARAHAMIALRRSIALGLILILTGVVIYKMWSRGLGAALALSGLVVAISGIAEYADPPMLQNQP